MTVCLFMRINEAIADFFADLERKLDVKIKAHGGFRGPTRPRKKPWNHALDLSQPGTVYEFRVLKAGQNRVVNGQRDDQAALVLAGAVRAVRGIDLSRR